MKVCFVGIGSIAKRHIKNLSRLCLENEIDLTIDAFRRQLKIDSDISEYISEVYTSERELPDDYDILFLTNPTEYHAEMLIKLHNKAKHFFIEKPIASLNTMEKLEGFQYRSESVYYVAAPLRYNKVIQYLKNEIDLTKVNSVRCISSSYLPEWRPGIDYRDTYSAHKELGGGVDIDLIHEWDYLTYLFGMPSEIKMFSGKVSNLEINSVDYAIYIAKYFEEMIAELHLDYFGREYIREIQLFMEDDTVVGYIEDGRIEFLKSGNIIEFKEERDDYQKEELLYFLSLINNKKGKNEAEKALKILKLTQGQLG